uniref:DUF3408 domain-containing protein n=1 Tax=Bacteroides ovatus TaxID=28116 RepID=UPI00359C909E
MEYLEKKKAAPGSIDEKDFINKVAQKSMAGRFLSDEPDEPDVVPDVSDTERKAPTDEEIEDFKRKYMVSIPKGTICKTIYIDGKLHRDIATLVKAAGCGTISGFVTQVLKDYFEKNKETIENLMGKAYQSWKKK